MFNNYAKPTGDRYVAIYNCDGIPQVVPFRTLCRGNTLLLDHKTPSGKHVEVSVSFHDANKDSADDWFVHTPNWGPIFADDCDSVCQFNCGDMTEGELAAKISQINQVLSLSDAEHAMSKLNDIGISETELRNFGFGFLLDDGVLKGV